MEDYFTGLRKEFKEAYELAKKARKKGKDPEEDVEVLPANDLAERVENLVGIDGMAEKINKYEEKGLEREKICLKITEELIQGSLGDLDNKQEIAEKAVRTSVALLTEGIVAAPIEGISGVTVEENGEYLRISYSGPIRSAGGTAQVVSVLVGDYVRQKLGINKFKATDEEVARYAEEIPLYKKIKNLQYTPSKDEIEKIIANCPILVDGESTEDEEVSGQRNLDRIKTNRVRGGMCLVIAEGLALKAPKLQRLVNDLGLSGWEWLNELIKKDEEETSSKDEKDVKYLSDLIAGRPVFSHPDRIGGFRLRYGRARNSGLATVGINPATMFVLGEFLSNGTQIKLDKPGKAAGIVAVDSIEGPTVKFSSGEVRRIDEQEVAKKLEDEIDEILDVGEMLVNYGDFLENNYELLQPCYSEEWWKLEAKKETETPSVSSAKESIDLSEKEGIPLHPEYTYYWNDLEVSEIKKLRNYIKKHAQFKEKLKIKHKIEIKEILEKLLIEHKINSNYIELNKEDSLVLIKSLGLDKNLEIVNNSNKDNSLEFVRDISGLFIREKAPTKIGCRMGRPEKSKERKMSPPTHVLFPLGEAGGKERSVEKAANKENIEVEVGNRICNSCGEKTYLYKCPQCGNHTEIRNECPKCEIEAEEKCPKCGKNTISIKKFDINISKDYKNALNNLEERIKYDKLKGVKGLTSKNKTPEPLEKGVLRAKHEQYVYKDGTIRYDLTDLPLTHLKPKEIDTSIDKLKELGYEKDVNGKKLEKESQVIELRPQDVILSKEAGEYLLKTTKFIDDLLDKFYGLEPFYEANNINELKGCLLVGLAPHTSAGVLSRLIGFTESQANFAHPYFHAAKRRNCFHPNSRIKYKEDNEWKEKTIQELVEDNLIQEKIKTDDFGTIYSETRNELIVPSVTKEGNVVFREIKKVQRTPSPEKLIKFETPNKKTLKVTPDHDMLVFSESNGIKKKPAHTIKKDEKLVLNEPKSNKQRKNQLKKQNLNQRKKTLETQEKTLGRCKDLSKSSFQYPRIVSIYSKEIIESETKYVYNLEVEETNSLFVNDIATFQCDGDEDCYMLLLDGLLNFSRKYLPDKTGGRMDAPLVLTYSLDPKEVDDEAHNLDIVSQYPLTLYEASLEKKGPKEIDVEIGEDRLGTKNALNDFHYTLETSNISNGPKESAYKKLGSMIDKTGSQLDLAKKIRAVDEKDVAERIIQSHFLPDLMGNLRAFSSQKVRCVQCNSKYRRPPLNGKCKECGGDLTLTVHENSVKKYLDVSKEVAEEYNVSNYVKERLNILEISIKSLFEDDQQTGLTDFM